MNKKLVIMLLTLGVVFVMAQSSRTKYLQEQLTIEIHKSIIASYSDWDAFLSKSMRFGMANMIIQESKKWDCYKGGIKISETEFYGTAGLPEYALKAKSYKEQRYLLGWGGFTVGMLGCGLMIAGIPAAVEEDNNTMCLVGLGVACVGLTFEIIGFTKPPKLTSVNFAVQVADEYNQQLKETFRE